MSSGYLTIASNAESVRMAVKLCQSIKLVDQARQVALVVDTFITVDSEDVSIFDYVIELPFETESSKNGDMYANVWQLYHCTPFDQTMFLNPACLMLQFGNAIWDHFGDRPVVTPISFLDFRGNQYYSENISDRFVCDIFYFDRSEETQHFFHCLEICSRNWKEMYPCLLSDETVFKRFLLKDSMKCASILVDLTLADPNWMISTVSHMSRSLNVWVIDGARIKVNNHLQHGILFYQTPSVVGKEGFDELDRHYNQKIKVN